MLSMEAETQPGIVRLRWNPESKVLQDAPGAVVWIADGTDESKLELTHAQLQSGALEYRPTGSDLNFRMEIGPFTESLRVSTAVPATAEEASIAATEEVAPERLTARTERRRRSAEAESKSSPIRTLNPLAATIQAEKPKDIEVPPPPQIAMAEAKLDKPPIPERAPELPKVMATVERPSSSPFASPLKKAFGWIPGVGTKSYVPPKAVRQVQPRVTTAHDTSVAVRVNIDSKGVVKEADLLTKGVDGHLGRSAVEAAKRWRFEPARADNRPVASDMVVRFRFEGTRN